MQPIHPVTKTINNQTAAFMSLFLASLYTHTATIIAMTNHTMARMMGRNNNNPNIPRSGKVNSIFFSLSFVFLIQIL